MTNKDEVGCGYVAPTFGFLVAQKDCFIHLICHTDQRGSPPPHSGCGQSIAKLMNAQSLQASWFLWLFVCSKQSPWTAIINSPL